MVIVNIENLTLDEANELAKVNLSPADRKTLDGWLATQSRVLIAGTIVSQEDAYRNWLSYARACTNMSAQVQSGATMPLAV